MKLGVNTVLYKPFDLRTALEGIKLAGYDGAELSAIAGMCEHLVLDEWQSQADSIRAMAEEIGITVISSPLTTYTACGELYMHGLPGTKRKTGAAEGE